MSKYLNKANYLITLSENMTNMTFALPEELHKIISKHKDIKWSEVARQALWERARKLELMDSILSKSDMTEESALELGRKVNKEIARRHDLTK